MNYHNKKYIEMSGLGLAEKERMSRLSQILTDLKSQGNLIGVLFAERNGKVIYIVGEENFNYEEFSSMCASVLESASELSKAMGEKRIEKIITEVEDKIIIILECDKNTFLVLMANSESHTNKVLSKMENYIKKLLILY